MNNTIKFKYDCFNNRLWKLENEYAYEVSDEQSFINSYGDQGFVLDTNQPNHWINFTIYGQKVRAFYKQISKTDGSITYYQKDIPREGSDFVFEFELTENDIVAKRDDGRWGKKVN